MLRSILRRRHATHVGARSSAAIASLLEGRRRVGRGAWSLPCLCVALVAQDPDGYDPMEGMDENGRIERPDLPSDIANPGRWRYTPPGRIAPGGVFDRFLISNFISPIVFREQDIGTGGGFALTDIDFRNQNYREFANLVVTYSTEGQQAYRINWRRWLRHRELENGGIIREERTTLFGQLEYSKTLTRRFYGFGSRTTPADETSYTEELTQVGFGGRISIPEPGDDFITRVGLRFQHHGLSRGRLSSVPSTNEVYPEEFAYGDGDDQFWVDLEVAFDSRDSLHQPYRGLRIGCVAQTVPVQSAGDPGGLVTVDARSVWPVPSLFHEGGNGREENPPTDVLAIGGFVTGSYGDLPFYSLPSLGGSDTLRGYIQNRFTDNAAAHASVEYRFGIVPRGFAISRSIRIERVNLGFFYDFGTVADDVGTLTDGKFLDSYGFGLRFSFSREASFRLDYGISSEDTNLTIAYGNSF